jgi:hypothetical protein
MIIGPRLITSLVGADDLEAQEYSIVIVIVCLWRLRDRVCLYVVVVSQENKYILYFILF